MLPFKPHDRDFPGGPVVKNPPSNAGDMGTILGGGTKILHATGQLEPKPKIKISILKNIMLSCAQSRVTPWTVACQALLSIPAGILEWVAISSSRGCS